MKITEITLLSSQISGNQNGAGLLLETADLKEYVNNQATDTIIGMKLSVVFPNNKFEKMIVKVTNKNNTITNEQIQAEGGQVPIVLKNLTGRLYRTSSGEYAISCSADSWERVKQ